MVTGRGRLSICPTPIGHLDDITRRVLQVMAGADGVICEDTRRTAKLMNHFDLSTPLISYHRGNRKHRLPRIMDRLLRGEHLALVTDAGTPLISDPGYQLVSSAIEQDIGVVSLPGPSAVITALAVSGIEPEPFSFFGFPPRRSKERKLVLKQVLRQDPAVIFFEAPHRLKQFLNDLASVAPQRYTCITRELTKRHEEIQRGTASDLAEAWQTRKPRGEFTIVIEGAKGTKTRREGETTSRRDADELAEPLTVALLADHVAWLIDRGFEPMPAIKTVARAHELPKGRVYDAYHRTGSSSS